MTLVLLTFKSSAMSRSSLASPPCWSEAMYGRKYTGVQRATFVIDPSGQVARVFPKVSPKTRDDVVLGALPRLAPA